MEKTDHRQFIRISKNKNLKLMTGNPSDKSGLLVSLTSVNLSESGILFESSRAYNIGEQYLIRFTGNDNRLYDARIEIIRTREIIPRTQYHIGAKFIDGDSEKIKRLLQ